MFLSNGTDYTERMSKSYPFIDPTMHNLTGKCVFITGASKGIGAAIAVSYAKAGASIIGIAARSSQDTTIEAIIEAANATGKSLPTIFAYKLDVTDTESVRSVAKSFASGTGGRLDILVNNAGYLPRFVPIIESDPEDWWEDWRVNVKGVFLLTREMLPMMLGDQKSDRTVVTLTSTSAHRTTYGGSSYQMTKLIKLRFSEFIGAEYGKQGVLAYAVNPGAVPTQMGEKVALDIDTPLVDSADVCADTITFLTSEKRDWLQGRYISALWNMGLGEKKKLSRMTSLRSEWRLVE